MAKTRVYELARDLNLTNKILLSKLSDLDISVKSHMSALDDEAVARIKTVIFGKKEEAVEETRVKPTVIRRRRKKVKVEVAPESPAEPGDVSAAEKPAEDAPEEKEPEKEAPSEEVTPEVEDEKVTQKMTPAAEAADLEEK
ncbi:MAG: translation initiation factor IF-2 N-terminal domain-containing protein, partial [Desulfobacterales bacterium]